MSYARSPRPVCSITMGTSIICGSFSLVFTFTCHTPPQRNALVAWRGFECVFSGLTLTDDTEIRGSFRCGFCSGFYRGPHPVSNECGPLRESVWSAGRGLRPRDSTRLRRPQFFPTPQCVPVTTTTSHPAQPDRAGLPASAAGPFSSCLPSSCPAPREPAGHARGADRFDGRPTTLELQNRCALPVPGLACPWLRARRCACARAPCSREF